MAPTKKSSILVVEDEAPTARDLQHALERLGYDVLPTTSCSQATARAFQHKPDLVLMDVLVDGTSRGTEAADVISTRCKIPIVFVMACADDVAVRHATRAAPYGFVVKPVRLEELRVVVDVALHKHAVETCLRERERWFSTTLHSISDAVISVDTGAAVTFMNAAAEHMTGVPSEHGVGRPIRDVLQLTPLPTAHQEGTTTSGNETPLERALRERCVVKLPEAHLKNHASGEQRIISDSAAPVFADGQLLGAVTVFRDVTEQRRLEEALRVSERMASVGLLAAGVAHEINNPLPVVMANAESLAATLTDPTVGLGELRQLLSDSVMASRRIRDIVRDLLLFSKSEAPEQRNVDLRDVMESSLRMARNTIRHRACVKTQFDAVPPVFGNASQLGQVFLNVLVNAAQAIPDGHADQHSIRVALSTSQDGGAVIEVADTGCGMSAATLKQLFTPFFTTKAAGMGTGLGLSICQRIVSSMGGRLHIDSEPDLGTTLRIWLPASLVCDEPTRSAPSSRTATRRGSVMVIDDEPTVADVLKRMLAPSHDVAVFHRARRALARLDAGYRYDVIVCDLMMPELTGIEFYHLVASRWPDQAARVVFVSGGEFTPSAAAFFESTKLLKLDKPVDVPALLTFIDSRLSD